MAEPKWTHVGDLPVDAGCLLVIDPCYLRDMLFEGNAQVEQWYEQAVVQAQGEVSPVSAPQMQKRPLGHVVSTGNGDGVYPLEVRFAKDGRVAEMRIRFIK